MKIALVVHRFFPEGSGGVEVLAYHLARALEARGYEVFVLCASLSERHGPIRFLRETYAGIPVIRIAGRGGGNPIRSTYCDETVGEAVAQLLATERPDLIHVWHCLFLSASVIEGALRANLPVVWTLTDYWPLCWKTTLLTWDDRLCAGDWNVPVRECLACLIFESRTYRRFFGRNRFWPRWLAQGVISLARSPVGERLVPAIGRQAVEALRARPQWFRMLVRRVDALVAVSPASFDLFRAAGFPVERLRLIEQTIAPFARGRATSERREGVPLRFGYVGRMNYAKGVDLLVRAFRLADLGARATLELFGAFEEASFQKQVQHLAEGDPRICFHGPFPPERLPDVLGRVDVLVIPSRWYETGPLTLWEAFAAGLPVICARLGEMARVLESAGGGLLFARGDEHALAAALRELVERPDLLARLRAEVRPVKPFEEMVREYEALYRECVRSPSERRASVEGASSSAAEEFR